MDFLLVLNPPPPPFTSPTAVFFFPPIFFPFFPDFSHSFLLAVVAFSLIVYPLFSHFFFFSDLFSLHIAPPPSSIYWTISRPLVLSKFEPSAWSFGSFFSISAFYFDCFCFFFLFFLPPLSRPSMRSTCTFCSGPTRTFFVFPLPNFLWPMFIFFFPLTKPPLDPLLSPHFSLSPTPVFL